jgi:uncharacterized Zn finger protein
MAPEDFWRGRLRLPETIEQTTPSPVLALNVNKGGDFPAFWKPDNSLPEAMEDFHKAVRRKAKL